MSRVRQTRAASANVIFTHGFYKRSFLKRCLTLSGLTQVPERTIQGLGRAGGTFFSQVRFGIPVVGISLNCPNQGNVSLRGVIATSQVTAAMPFQRAIQSADLFFRKWKSQTNISKSTLLRTRGDKKMKKSFAIKLKQLPLHIKCKLQKDNRLLKFEDCFHCGIVESFEKSSRVKCCSMTRQSIIWNPNAWPMRAFKSCGSGSTPVITEALSRWSFRGLCDLALERFFAEAHCAWACL